MWKALPNDNILAWNKLALSQQDRCVLGTGANLFARPNYWIVACGGQPSLVPPTLLGVENWVKARKKDTEILYIFFGIHTANVVQLAERLKERQEAEAA